MEKKWYLAGPICFVKDDSDRGWREEAKKHLACIDPFEQEKIGGPVMNEYNPGQGYQGIVPDYESPKERFNRLRYEGEVVQVRKEMQEILRIDLEAVLRCFGVLAYSPEPTWGTIRECALAHLFGKPVVVWTEVANPYDLANTLIGVSSVIADDFDEAIGYCKDIEVLDGMGCVGCGLVSKYVSK